MDLLIFTIGYRESRCFISPIVIYSKILFIIHVRDKESNKTIFHIGLTQNKPNTNPTPHHLLRFPHHVHIQTKLPQTRFETTLARFWLKLKSKELRREPLKNFSC